MDIEFLRCQLLSAHAFGQPALQSGSTLMDSSNRQLSSRLAGFTFVQVRENKTQRLGTGFRTFSASLS
ncbi:hypothetical protein CW304_32970 [Bacillus sp. UFRGS-B20]|nr:hypothetical protein CW304_32970 [Bacillus sp. UFRGS-B20]